MQHLKHQDRQFDGEPRKSKLIFGPKLAFKISDFTVFSLVSGLTGSRPSRESTCTSQPEGFAAVRQQGNPKPPQQLPTEGGGSFRLPNLVLLGSLPSISPFAPLPLGSCLSLWVPILVWLPPSLSNISLSLSLSLPLSWMSLGGWVFYCCRWWSWLSKQEAKL